MSPSPLQFFSDLFANPKPFLGEQFTGPGRAIYKSPSGKEIKFSYEDITT